jgi:hypothetical protein
MTSNSSNPFSPEAPRRQRYPAAPHVTLNIAQEIIDVAVVADSSHCIYADAVKAACPWATHISVDVQTIRFTDPRRGLRYTYLTPRSAQIGIIKFDQGHGDIQPHRVQLRNGQVTRSGARRAAGKTATEAQMDALRKAQETRYQGAGVHDAGAEAAAEAAGARVAPMGSRHPRQAGARAAHQPGERRDDVPVEELGKATLVSRERRSAGDDRRVPDKVGGKTPPLMTPRSRRRAFGLRAMDL